MSSNFSQHQSLKRAFLFAPYGDYDTKFVSDLQNENGLSSVQVKHWFMVMRQRMNVKEFVSGDIEYSDITDENVTDDVKQSGRSPMDVLVDFSGLKLQPKASVRDDNNDTPNGNDSGNFEEEVSSNEEDSVVIMEKDNAITKKAPEVFTNEPLIHVNVNAPLFDGSLKRESKDKAISKAAPEMATNGAPDNWDDMDVSNLVEALHVNTLLSPKKESKIKQEPEIYNENGKCQQMPEVGNIKEEKLSVEEKAKKYDHLKLEMEGLEKQMEEMRKRLEAQNPPAEVNIKQEPGLQQLSQQPFYFQQPQIVNPWQQQQAHYSSYENQYPVQPHIVTIPPQQQQQYNNFQPQQFIRQDNQSQQYIHFHQQPHQFTPQPQGVVLQYQVVQGQHQLQSNSAPIKSEPSGTSF